MWNPCDELIRELFHRVPVVRSLNYVRLFAFSVKRRHPHVGLLLVPRLHPFTKLVVTHEAARAPVPKEFSALLYQFGQNLTVRRV
jgi:hypothetical protein